MEDGGISTFQHEGRGAYIAPVSTFRHQTAFASQGLPKAQPYALASYRDHGRERGRFCHRVLWPNDCVRLYAPT
jgi:hypothetical protein